MTAAHTVSVPAPNGFHSSNGLSERTRLSRGELLGIFAFWTVIGLLMAANRIIDPRPATATVGFLSAPVGLAFIEAYLWAALTPAIFWLSSRFSLDRSNIVSRAVLLAGLGLAIAIFVDLATAYIRLEVLQIPSRRTPGFDPMYNLSRLWFLNDLIVFIAVLAAGFARDYFLRFRARQDETIRLQAHAANLQAQLAEARLATLRTQINPHFLFNTLHAVSSLVERDPRGVRRMIARLSELLRHSLDDAGEQEIPLSQELEFAGRYLEIMQIRFQGHLDVRTDAEPAALDALVPHFVLQPVIENAIKHGVSSVTGAGRVEIMARVRDDRLVLTVSDNGPGLSDGEPPEEGIGLRNTRERLMQLYGDEQSLILRPREGGGLTVELALPYHTRSDLIVAELSA